MHSTIKADFDIVDHVEVGGWATRFRWVILGQIIAAGLIALYITLIFSPSSDASLLLRLAGWLVIGFFAWAVYSWRTVTGHVFHPYVLFMLSAVLFNGGHFVLDAFRLNEPGSVFDYYSQATLLVGIILILIGLWAFHSGALFFAIYRLSRKTRLPAETDVPPGAMSATLTVGFALIAVAALPFMAESWDLLSLRMTAEYIVIYQQQSVVGAENWRAVLAQFLVPGAFFIMAAAGSRKLLLAIPILCVLAVSMVWFAVGERSHGVMPVMAAAWLWHTRVRRIPRWFLACVGAFFLTVVFPVLAIMRNEPLSGRSSFGDIFATIDKPLVSSLTEMGGSFRTVADTIVLVPDTRPHGHGLGYAHALLNIFPNTTCTDPSSFGIGQLPLSLRSRILNRV